MLIGCFLLHCPPGSKCVCMCVSVRVWLIWCVCCLSVVNQHVSERTGLMVLCWRGLFVDLTFLLKCIFQMLFSESAAQVPYSIFFHVFTVKRCFCYFCDLVWSYLNSNLLEVKNALWLFSCWLVCFALCVYWFL